MFPRGNHVEDVSVFVDVADADDLPRGWKRNADFLLTIVNHKDRKKSIKKGLSHSIPPFLPALCSLVSWYFVTFS